MIIIWIRFVFSVQVDLNNDGVIDYNEFLTLVKGKYLGLGSKRRKAFRQLLRETVDFLVPYKYTYQNQYSCLPPPLFMLTLSLLQIIIFVFNSLQQIGDISMVKVSPLVQFHKTDSYFISVRTRALLFKFNLQPQQERAGLEISKL